jgi:hypothetical protein
MLGTASIALVAAVSGKFAVWQNLAKYFLRQMLRRSEAVRASRQSTTDQISAKLAMQRRDRDHV